VRRGPVTTTVALWAARVAWLLVAVAGGSAVGHALDDRSRAVQVVGTIVAWAGFAVGAVALALPGVVTLTLVRATVPAAPVVAAFALAFGADPGDGLVLAAPAIAATALVASAEVGRAYLQASAYGDELRFGLRPPVGYLLASGLTWLVLVSALVVAPVAWAGRAWAAAVVTTAVAVAGLLVLPRRWHQLSRRWLVLVPAGVVVHDPVVLADTVMMRAATITSVGLDELGVATQRAADLTGPTPGLAVEIRLRDAVTVVFAPRPGQRDGQAMHATAVVVSPTRPGAVLKAAAARRLPVAKEASR
jgi:hypothetical protein